jgi:hypothetical protein
MTLLLALCPPLWPILFVRIYRAVYGQPVRVKGRRR